MQLFFQQFYKMYGVRRITNLLTPRLNALRVLPRDSVLHYLTEDQVNPNLDPSKAYFGDLVKKIVVDYPSELISLEGSPRKQAILLRPLVREFHRTNKKFRFVPNAINMLNDSYALFVLNYSYLDHIYRYSKVPIEPYQRFFNSYKTVFTNIHAISQSKLKNHFIFVDLPEILPSYNLLNMYVGKTSRTMLNLFKGNSSLFLLQFWQWLSDVNREATIFSDLTEDDLNKTNLVFTATDGRSTVINLGYINSWIKGHEKTTDENDTTQIKPVVLQKLFLKLYMTLTARIPEEQMLQDLQTSETAKDADADEVRDLEQELQAYQTEHDDTENDIVEEHEYQDNLAAGYADLSKGISRASPNEDVKKRIQDTENDINASLVQSFAIGDRLKEIDKDLDLLDKLTSQRLKERGLHLDKDGNEIVSQDIIEDIPLEVLQNRVYGNDDYETSLQRHLDNFSEFGLITASDYKKLLKDIDGYKISKDPYGTGELTVEAMVVPPELIKLDANKTKIAVSDTLSDKSMAESSLQAFDREYVKHVIKKDMLAMVNTVQKSGLIVRKHEVEHEHSVMGSYENHTLELKPIDGQASTLRFRLPVINEDGSFIANGNKYAMRKQRVDVPIRKTNPFTVALTSYYGKTFVSVSQKKVNNSLAWLIKQINLATMQDSHPVIQRVGPANVFDNNIAAPYIYSALGSAFKTIDTDKYHLSFDHTERKTFLGEGQSLETFEKDGSFVVGKTIKDDKPIIVDKKNIFRIMSPDGMTSLAIGNIYQMLDLSQQDSPQDFTEIKLFSKSVPVGIMLGYILGFKNLLKFTEAKYEVVEGRQTRPLEPHEYVIAFKGIKYILDRRQETTALILAGFNDFDKQLRQYPPEEFDKKDVYLNLLATKGLGSLYIREMDLIQQLFVDPITKSILEQMQEPTTFAGLLVRSTEMLKTYHHPDGQDMHHMRIRGYERLPGTVYKELVTQIRSYKNRNIAGKSRVEMSPYQVWQSVMKDSTIKLIEDINPIQNLKESEIVTYVGTGGRNKDAMNRESRAFHENDMGVISEATVDSSDVGINAYLSANPNFEDMRGIIKQDKDFNPVNVLSTSALLAPGSNHDDPKRVNFVSIQNGHGIRCDGYHPAQVRTGYEYVIGNRTSDMFAFCAKDDGKVISIDDKGIVIQYKDGSQKGVSLGRSYGKAEGTVYPHDIVSDMKAGQSFKKGDPIAYNSGFFEKDYLDPTRIVLKTTMTVKTALLESNQTFEDASSISHDLGQRLKTRTTKVRSFIINFNQNLINTVKIGQEVDPKTILMIIEDEITSASDIFDKQSLEVLHRLSNQAPKANYLGKVDKIEVFYHGDKKDMSSSLKRITDYSDKLIADSCKSTGKPVIDGRVNDDYRVAGTPLALDQAEVKFYITVETVASNGDKGIFANQLKSVIGEVMDYNVHTESGEKIDAFFGSRSVMARIVESPYIIGTTITLLNQFAEKAVNIYKG